LVGWFNSASNCTGRITINYMFILNCLSNNILLEPHDFRFYNIDPCVSSGKTISFIHCFDLEGKAFKEEVLKLYDRFGRCLGYKCHLDKSETIQVAENKFRYVLNNVKDSDFVFICVSPKLKRIFDLPHKEISNSLEGWS